MFAVIYTFEVIPGKEETFVEAWRELTLLIFLHEGSKGSRLHKNEFGNYMAYALWPDKMTWENSGDKLPEIANTWRSQMRESCTNIETSFELNVIEDLLKA